jgi:hypothetical protein
MKAGFPRNPAFMLFRDGRASDVLFRDGRVPGPRPVMLLRSRRIPVAGDPSAPASSSPPPDVTQGNISVTLRS